MPVIIDEFGPSTVGNSVDAGGTALVNVVLNSGLSYSAFTWYPGFVSANNLTSDAGGTLTSYGIQVAAGIAAAAGAPGVPTGLAAGTATTTTMPLTWTAPTGGAATYTVQYAVHGTGTWTTATSTITVTNYTVTGLTANTSYDFQVAGANTLGTLGPYSTLVTKSTTQAQGSPTGITTAAQLVAYFKQIQGNHTVSGQYISTGSDPTYGSAALQTIQTQTGQWLGLVGGDYYVAGQTGAPTTTFNTYATSYWQAGGLVMLSLQMPNPTTGGPATDTSALNVSQLLTTGNATNTAFVNTLNQIGTGLQALQAAGVVVIIRPFQAPNTNQYWWGASLQTAAQFQAMWQYARNYWSTTMNLNNLVYDWAIASGVTLAGRTLTDTFPGAAYTDMTGEILYTSTPTLDNGTYTALNALGLPTSLSEFGSGTAACGDTTFSMPALIAAFQSNYPNDVFWQQMWGKNSVSSGCPTGVGWGMELDQNTSAALANAWVINRGQIIYNGSNPGGTTVTWNPGDTTTSVALSGSNLIATANVTSLTQGSRVTVSYSTGKYCFAVTMTTASIDWGLGIANSSYNLILYSGLGADTNGVGFYPVSPAQSIYYGGVPVINSNTPVDVSGAEVDECVDLTAHLIWATTPAQRSAGYTWNKSTTANPATGVGGASFSGLTCPCYITWTTGETGSAATLKAGGPMAVALPSGFSFWQPPVVSTHHPIMTILGANDNWPKPVNDDWPRDALYTPIRTGGRDG